MCTPGRAIEFHGMPFDISANGSLEFLAIELLQQVCLNAWAGPVDLARGD